MLMASSSCISLVATDYSNDDIEMAGGTAFSEVQPGAGFENGDFLNETLGGSVVERLTCAVAVA